MVGNVLTSSEHPSDIKGADNYVSSASTRYIVCSVLSSAGARTGDNQPVLLFRNEKPIHVIVSKKPANTRSALVIQLERAPIPVAFTSIAGLCIFQKA